MEYNVNEAAHKDPPAWLSAFPQQPAIKRPLWKRIGRAFRAFYLELRYGHQFFPLKGSWRNKFENGVIYFNPRSTTPLPDSSPSPASSESAPESSPRS